MELLKMAPVLFVYPIVSSLGEKSDPAASLEIKRFEVPEGKAIKTLRQAANQAKVEFMVPAEIVRGIQTPAVKGEFTPLEAFNQMLAGTSLVVFRHPKSGIYGIKRIERPDTRDSR